MQTDKQTDIHKDKCAGKIGAYYIDERFADWTEPMKIYDDMSSYDPYLQ